MPPKRKATASGRGGLSKRIASGAATPMSTGDSDEYTEDTSSVVEDDDDVDEDIKQLMNKVNSQYTIHRKTQAMDQASHFFRNDNSSLQLKPDHANRPLWIDPYKHRIIVESFSPSFKEAESFLINIAEPQSRTLKMHEYSLTVHSLFAAVSVGLKTEDILRRLDLLCKSPLPEETKLFIENSTKSFGKVRLVLQQTKHYLESQDPEVLRTLLRDPEIAKCQVQSEEGKIHEAAAAKGDLYIPGTKATNEAKKAANATAAFQNQGDEDPDTQAEDIMNSLREDEDDEEEIEGVHRFQIASDKVEQVRKRCRFPLELPVTEEYDFRNDFNNPDLDIDLKPEAQIRPYQEQALNKMFGNGRAKSGIIVLPCGAGKTLVGITAACTVKKGVIVLCTSSVSVVQWRQEFLKWSNINAEDVVEFTSENKNIFPGPTGIIITTYSMISSPPARRSHESQKIFENLYAREWGLMILDEVHVAPASTFKQVAIDFKAHSKLGLTATLIREDNKIEDLNFLIGPKLYEANWQELSDQGHIAKVECGEVWCPMSTEFYDAYLRTTSQNKRALIFAMNPNKFQRCQYLIWKHEARGDKIIVFSDNLWALEMYAKKLGKAFISGQTPPNERIQILDNFRYNDEVKTVFLSKIGDTSLDLPEATCLIQISAHYGSRRQEAQRLGRILRAKRRSDEGFNAFFYSLVSKDTMEMYYSSKRQAFLVDQGYAFRVITKLPLWEHPGLHFATDHDRKNLLSEVENQNDDAGLAEKIEGDLWSGQRAGSSKRKSIRRTAGMLGDLSGGQNMAYVEGRRNMNKDLMRKGKKDNKLFSRMKRDIEKRAEARGK